MNEWKLLLLLEYKWRVFRLYRKLLNYLLRKKVSLTSPLLCFITKKLDKNGMMISQLKYSYEMQTGVKLVFYKCDEYR